MAVRCWRLWWSGRREIIDAEKSFELDGEVESFHKGTQLRNNLAVISTAEVLRVAHAFSYRSGESLETSICGSELATQKAFEFARKRLA